jgi:3',5'-cyclic AMP phosphodiesterase CpdA
MAPQRKTRFFLYLVSLGLVVLFTVLFLASYGKPPPVTPDKRDPGILSKITGIIYPTIGYPQIVPAGKDFTLEFDFTADDPDAPQPEKAEGWRVSIASSNGYIWYEDELEVSGVEVGESRRWPPGSGREVYRVWQVTARVPSDVPPDLYDLEVRVEVDGKTVVDTQPNCLAVSSGFKENYRVVHISDAHVFDVTFPFSCHHDRGLRDAAYLRKVVDQINLINPDFAIFTGDLIFGQKYLPRDWPPDGRHSGSSEYEYELLWAYQALCDLDVPCFMIPGNHDAYNDTARDGCEWWTDLFGPLYYSFDYGDDHYTMINTMDWSLGERTLEKAFYYRMFGVLQPGKWQGQVLSGGDRWGETQAPPPQSYGGQLGWIRDDLAASQGAGMRIACCHHDPTQVKSWDDADYIVFTAGGRGEGMLALRRLFADYRVNLNLSGHEHHDLVSRLPWSDGSGHTVYANTTCIEPMCGTRSEYPGYRLVEISGNDIASLNYQGPDWSYPYYRGVVPGAENDLDPLYDPAVCVSFSNGGDWSAAREEVSCRVDNGLDKDFRGARLEFFMPRLGGGKIYQVSGTGGFDAVQGPAPGRPSWTIVYVYMDLPARSVKEIRLSPP